MLADRIGELRSGLLVERGLEAELDEICARARKAASSQDGSASDRPTEGELRLLKAELEGLVGELLARRSERRDPERGDKNARRDKAEAGR